MKEINGGTIMSDGYINYKDRVVNVIGKYDDFYIHTENKGYVKNGTVWIYLKKKPLMDKNRYPYIYPSKDGGIEYSKPSKETMEGFSEKNIYDLSLLTIVEQTKDSDVMYNEQAINDLNNAASKYVPVINDTDDYLKKIVKEAIVRKNVDINRLKCKMAVSYNLLNMKQALEKSTKMSVVYFASWMEILGLDFEIKIKDNGQDKIDPLQETLVYSSAIDRVVTEKEFNDPALLTKLFSKSDNDEE